ncbi:MAG: bifunctional 5,10-methylenetetrahydrofolate dehydrogenase/5,10-methenyltetrahydrofolate cyclohydrolase [Patescibacteria group bacterium]|nr:bifunctional 5,10-methylenetetrahydrofolate dehydrogenase/5,10-methenyltetrahydrofolate cyclohydrolase [Patescibacteria group bacterium]
MSKILDGKVIKMERKEKFREAFAELGFVSTLAIIQIGNREDSNSYIASKKKFGTEIGVKVEHIIFPENVHENEIIAKITELNDDKNVNGIIVQLPMPVSIDKDKVIDSINPKKDVDGLTSTSLKYLYEGKEGGFVPATTLGILNLLDYYKIPLEGKKVTIVGRSSLVGKPTMLALLNEDATVTICHSKTLNLKEHTQNADILIVAIGRAKFINHEFVSSGQIVIDVGTNMVDGKIVGDVDFDEVFDIVEAITPVPGGVGQMTVLSLFENVLKSCKK